MNQLEGRELGGKKFFRAGQYRCDFNFIKAIWDGY
jgi:hypothetical protein